MSSIGWCTITKYLTEDFIFVNVHQESPDKCCEKDYKTFPFIFDMIFKMISYDKFKMFIMRRMSYIKNKTFNMTNVKNIHIL